MSLNLMAQKGEYLYVSKELKKKRKTFIWLKNAKCVNRHHGYMYIYVQDFHNDSSSPSARTIFFPSSLFLSSDISKCTMLRVNQVFLHTQMIGAMSRTECSSREHGRWRAEGVKYECFAEPADMLESPAPVIHAALVLLLRQVQ